MGQTDRSTGYCHFSKKIPSQLLSYGSKKGGYDVGGGGVCPREVLSQPVS